MRLEGKKVKGDVLTAWIIRGTCDAFGRGDAEGSVEWGSVRTMLEYFIY